MFLDHREEGEVPVFHHRDGGLFVGDGGNDRVLKTIRLPFHEAKFVHDPQFPGRTQRLHADGIERLRTAFSRISCDAGKRSVQTGDIHLSVPFPGKKSRERPTVAFGETGDQRGFPDALFSFDDQRGLSSKIRNVFLLMKKSEATSSL